MKIKSNVWYRRSAIVLVWILVFAMMAVKTDSKIDITLTDTKQNLSVTNGSIEIAKKLGIGWNLGNTLDAYDEDQYLYEEEVAAGKTSLDKETFYETYWGNPKTTQSMIDSVKEKGFNTVRIPVTFYNHMDQEGNIDQAWLARIKEVVDYVLNDDMYCIINVHHDTGINGWLRADEDTLEDVSQKFSKLWKQYATYFNGYDDHLIFEGYNELLNTDNKWSWADIESYEAANRLNQVFVDTVRATGGENANRPLIVTTYASNSDAKELQEFELPTDTAQNRLLVQVHYYGYTSKNIDAMFLRLERYFTDQGIGVVIGEFGTSSNVDVETRKEAAYYYAREAAKREIAALWWDDGVYREESDSQCYYSLFDKVSMVWTYPQIVESLVNGYADGIEQEETFQRIRMPIDVEDAIEFYRFTEDDVFDTGYKVEDDDVLEFEFQLPEEKAYGYYFGAYTDNSNRLYYRLDGDNGVYIGYGWAKENVYKPSEKGEKVTILQEATKVYVNGNITMYLASQDMDIEDTLKIGGFGYNFHRLTIYDDSESEYPIYDFIPIQLDNDKEGIYDLVSKRIVHQN